MQRLFLGLIRRCRRALAEGQRVLLRFRVIVILSGNNRRTGLAVPAAEMGKIDVGGIFHCLDEVITGRRAAVMTLKVQLHPFLEIRLTEQGVDHANNFCALFIHGQGVEIVHFDDPIRADRMRHRTGIFSKLQAAHGAHIADPVNRSGTKIRTELLIAENG